jgi:hypothetical protein
MMRAIPSTTAVEAPIVDGPTLRMLCWVALSGVVAALLLPLTQALAGQQDADGLLTALISTRRLTWYFWEQDRFLNLLPALAKAFRDPETNLHAQVFLRAWSTYLSPLAILVFFTSSTRTLVVTIALANAMLIASLSFYGWFNLYVQHNPFGASLVLFALAWLVSARPAWWRVVAAAALCWLAYATNLALLVFTGPFLFLLMVCRRQGRARLFWFGVLNGAAILGAVVHARRMKLRTTQFGMDPSLDALVQAAARLHEHVNVPAALLIGGVFLLCATTLSRGGGQRRMLLRDLSAPALAAIVMAAALSMAVWVRMNDFNLRYFLTAAIALATVMAYVIVLRLMQAGMSTLHAAAGLLVAYASLVLGPMGGFTHGWRELVRHDHRSESRAVAEAAMDAQATMIIGDFWEVWPAVYETQRQRFGAGDRLPIFGAAERASPLGREFRARAGDGSEQRALCFFTTTEACLDEVQWRLHLPPDEQVLPMGVRTVTVNGRPMLDIGFRLAPLGNAGPAFSGTRR